MEAVKNRKFFTFCFVPLIPLSFGTVLTCSICNHSQKVDVKELEGAKFAGGTGTLQGYQV